MGPYSATSLDVCWKSSIHMSRYKAMSSIYSSAPIGKRADAPLGSRLKSPTYGKRGGMGAIDRGIRSVAGGFGKAPVLTHSSKAGGSIVLESEAERFVAHMLNLDPEVLSYSPQPFSIELISGSIARSSEEKYATARARAKTRKLRHLLHTITDCP